MRRLPRAEEASPPAAQRGPAAPRSGTRGGDKPVPVRRRAVLLALPAAALAAGCGVIQQRLLYFPEPATVAQLAVGSLRAWPDAHAFRGLAAEPPVPARATAIVFHGNAGHAGHRNHYAAMLPPLGLRVILAEYPGYGPRAGRPGEAAFAADAIGTVELAHRLHGAPLVLIGESLGAAVAAQAAAARPELVAGLLLLTPWDRLDRVAAHHYPRLPVRWFLHERYDSAAHLASFARPVAVVVAAADCVVPTPFGESLHAVLSGPKRLFRIEGAGHNDWPARLDAAWWREVLGFLLDDAARR